MHGLLAQDERRRREAVRTVLWYASGWLYMITTLPALLRLKYLERRGRYGERDRLADRVTARMARTLFYLTGSTVEVRGRENLPDQPALYVSNHQSHMDSAVIHGFIEVPKGFVSVKEAEKIPILSTWMRYMRCVFIDRNDLKQTFRCIGDCARLLKEGHSMVIYPEGKLDQGKAVNEFKKGCLRMAVKANVPIVPIALRDSYRVMKKNGTGIRAAKVTCIVSEPIPANVVAGSDENDLIERVREIIVRNTCEQPCP